MSNHPRTTTTQLDSAHSAPSMAAVAAAWPELGSKLLSEARLTAQKAEVSCFQAKRREPLTNTFLNFIGNDEEGDDSEEFPAVRMRRCRSAEFSTMDHGAERLSIQTRPLPKGHGEAEALADCSDAGGVESDDGTCSTGVASAQSPQGSHMREGWESPRSWTTESDTQATSEETPLAGTHVILDASLPANNLKEGDTGVTTMIIQNLPRVFARKDLMDILDEHGISVGTHYDFVHVSFSFSTGMCLGYGFVNFKSSRAAEEFRATWHGTDLFTRIGVRHNKLLVVEPARVQGLTALLAQRGMKKFMSVKTAALRPYYEKPPADGSGHCLCSDIMA